MSAFPLPDDDPLNESLARRREPVCDSFEAAWRAGQQPRIEDFLREFTEAEAVAVVRELVALDIWYRQRLLPVLAILAIGSFLLGIAADRLLAASQPGLDPAMFGKHPDGSRIEAASLCVKAPSVVAIRLPADLFAGTEFVATGMLML